MTSKYHWKNSKIYDWCVYFENRVVNFSVIAQVKITSFVINNNKLYSLVTRCRIKSNPLSNLLFYCFSFQITIFRMGKGCSQDDIDIAILTATLKGTSYC